MAVVEPTKQEQDHKGASAEHQEGASIAVFPEDVEPVAHEPHQDHEQHATGDPEAPRRVEEVVDRAPHAPSQVEAVTLPQPDHARNPAATTLEHADAMLGYLRSVPAGYGHELARAMLASSTFYLRETFGQAHALAVTADLVAPLAVPVEPQPTRALAVTVH